MLNQEMAAKARQAKSVDELMTLAEENNYPLTREQAEKTFAEFQVSGEISDDELDNVSGGCTTSIEGVEYRKVGNSDGCSNMRHGKPPVYNNTCQTCPHCHPIPGKLLGLYCDVVD